MPAGCSGVILAGGLNSRFAGRNKALMAVQGEPILDHIYQTFQTLFASIVLVTNHPLDYLRWDLQIVSDLFRQRSSLTGIHSALFHARTPHVFISACDTPFLQPDLVRMLTAAVAPGIDLVVPRTADGYEPLCAVYSARCMPVVENLLRRKIYKIQQLFRKVRLRVIPEQHLRKSDPELLSFVNINTPAQLNRARQMLSSTA
jgi:molybdopterin-guanine dinucleotide biosynthesis protein A